MRTFRLLVLRRFGQAPGRALTTVVAIAAGVSLAVSISILLGSIDRSLDDFGRDLAGPAPLRITGATLHGGLPMEATERADDVEGVAAVIPMVQTAARTQRAPGAELVPTLVLGVDCRIEALTGPFGCDDAALAAAEGPIAVGPRQDVGPDAVLRTDLGRMPLTGAPVVASLRAGGGRTVLLPLELAQERFTRPDQVDVAYVLLEPGAAPEQVRSALQDAVGEHLPVLAAAEPPAGASSVLGAALPIYSMLGLFALGVGGVLVSNVAAMSLEARRRELAVLGALGGRRRTVVGATVAEMAVLGVGGGLLGAAGGAVVANPIVESLSTFTEEVAGIELATHVGPASIVSGVLLGVLLGAGAALFPARRATRLDVAGELSGRDGADRARPPRLLRRFVLWSGLVMVGALGCWAAPRAGGLEPWQSAIVAPAFLAVTLGTLFAAAAATPMLLGRAKGVVSTSGSAPLRVALAAAVRDHRRTGVLAITVSAAVVTAFVTEASSAGARASIEASFQRSGAGVDVATAPPNAGIGSNLPPDAIAALARVPGVARVDVGRFVVAGPSDELILVESISNSDLGLEVIDGVADGDRLDAGEVLIGAGLARRQSIRAGDRVEVPTPSGTVELPVQGVWEDGNNVGRNVFMAPAHLEELYGPQPAQFVTARPAPGLSEAELAARIRAAQIDSELRTRPSADVADGIADEVDASFASFRVMQQALLAVLFVAVLSSLLLAAVQRRRELGLLTAVGAAPSGLVRTLLTEAGLVAGAGLVCALVGAPLTAWALNRLLPFVVGFVNPLVLVWSSFATAGLTALVVALIAAAWPARRAARVEVLEALRYE